jgi:hypothetical protein
MSEPTNKPKRADKATVLRRTEEILRIRLDGAELWDVREYVKEQEAKEGSPWHVPEGGKGLSDVQLWRYIAKADALVAESCRSSRRKLLRRHLAQRRNLYAKAVLQGDVKAALAVLRDEAELLDLYPSAEAKLAAEVEALKKMLAEAEARRTGGTTNGDGHTQGGDQGTRREGPGDDHGDGADAPGAHPPRPGPDTGGGGDAAGPLAEGRPNRLWE